MQIYRVDIQLSVNVEAKSAAEVNRIIDEAGVEMTGENRGRFSDCWLDAWNIYDEDDNPVEVY